MEFSTLLNSIGILTLVAIAVLQSREITRVRQSLSQTLEHITEWMHSQERINIMIENKINSSIKKDA